VISDPTKNVRNFCYLLFSVSHVKLIFCGTSIIMKVRPDPSVGR